MEQQMKTLLNNFILSVSIIAINLSLNGCQSYEDSPFDPSPVEEPTEFVVPDLEIELDPLPPEPLPEVIVEHDYITITYTDASGPDVFHLEGQFSDEQIALLQEAQREWCDVGTQFGKSEAFCTRLGSNGDSFFKGRDDLTDKYYGMQCPQSIIDGPQWVSGIELDNKLEPWLFYHVAKHELGHHFCVSHKNDGGLMEAVVANSKNSDITEALILAGDCEDGWN